MDRALIISESRYSKDVELAMDVFSRLGISTDTMLDKGGNYKRDFSGFTDYYSDVSELSGDKFYLYISTHGGFEQKKDLVLPFIPFPGFMNDILYSYDLNGILQNLFETSQKIIIADTCHSFEFVYHLIDNKTQGITACSYQNVAWTDPIHPKSGVFSTWFFPEFLKYNGDMDQTVNSLSRNLGLKLLGQVPYHITYAEPEPKYTAIR